MATSRSALKAFMAREGRKRPPPNHGQSYVSQGRAVENAANARNYTQGRARTEREQSQQRMRHALGYDKPGITASGVKRKARKALHKVNPFD